MASKDDPSQRERIEAAAEKTLAKTASFAAALEAAKLREQQFAEALDRDAAERRLFSSGVSAGGVGQDALDPTQLLSFSARAGPLSPEAVAEYNKEEMPYSSRPPNVPTGPMGKPVINSEKARQLHRLRNDVREAQRIGSDSFAKQSLPVHTWDLINKVEHVGRELEARPIPDAELRAPASKTPPDPLASRPGGRTTTQIASVTEEPTPLPPLSQRERIEAAADKALASKADKASK